MSLKSILALVCALSIGFATSPSYAGDIISCDSFENCPDGSVPLTNAILELQARMDALEAENTRLIDGQEAGDTLVWDGGKWVITPPLSVSPVVMSDTAELRVLTNGTEQWLCDYAETGNSQFNRPPEDILFLNFDVTQCGGFLSGYCENAIPSAIEYRSFYPFIGVTQVAGQRFNGVWQIPPADKNLTVEWLAQYGPFGGSNGFGRSGTVSMSCLMPPY